MILEIRWALMIAPAFYLDGGRGTRRGNLNRTWQSPWVEEVELRIQRGERDWNSENIEEERAPQISWAFRRVLLSACVRGNPLRLAKNKGWPWSPGLLVSGVKGMMKLVNDTKTDIGGEAAGIEGETGEWFCQKQSSGAPNWPWWWRRPSGGLFYS